MRGEGEVVEKEEGNEERLTLAVRLERVTIHGREGDKDNNSIC